MKKLLVLGGTKISCEIVLKAKEMGYYVTVTDYNPPEKSPAKLLADEHFLVSATDVDAVVELIHREHIDGVMVGYADVLLPYYAEICRKADLPSFGTREQFDLFTDKDQYKRMLNSYGIPVPASYNSDTWESENINFPVIVKPADSSGARGCIVCENKNELKCAMDNALQYSRKGSAIIEEFVTGPEATVFFLIRDGRAYFTVMANRHVENHQGEGVIALPVGYTYPASLTDSYLKDIAPKVIRMLGNEGVRNGMLFMQCVISKGVPKVYDIGLRLTASLEYYMLEKACGYNPLEMMIRYAVTGDMGELTDNQVDPYLNGQYGWNVSTLIRPGKISAIVGLDKVKELKDVIVAVPSYDVGEELGQNDVGLLKQIGCRIIGLSNNMESMESTISAIRENFDILDQDGKSMLLPVLNPRNYLDKIHIH